MEAVDELKTAGNDAYKTKDYSVAISTYSEAIEACKKLEGKTKDEKLAILYCNRCAANLAIKKGPAAVRDALLAQSADPTNWKGWYRHAKALALLTPKIYRTRDAIKSLKTCRELSTLPVNQVATVDAALAHAHKVYAALEENVEMAPMDNCVIC